MKRNYKVYGRVLNGVVLLGVKIQGEKVWYTVEEIMAEVHAR